MPVVRQKPVKLEQALGLTFRNPELLHIALTHRSVGVPNNERLEFLGDSLLGAIIAEALYHRFPTGHEGQLTRLRSSLVKRDTLAKIARRYELGSYLKLGEGELKTAGWRRSSILENALEAVIGAVYIDSGFVHCREFVLSLYQDLLNTISLDDVQKDPKTKLQEYLQAKKLSVPTYTVLSTIGKSHEQLFTVSCHCSELPAAVQAQGSSRRSAEQAAAQQVLDLLEKR